MVNVAKTAKRFLGALAIAAGSVCICSATAMAEPLTTAQISSLSDPFYVGELAASPVDARVAYVVEHRAGSDDRRSVMGRLSYLDGTKIWIGDPSRGTGAPLVGGDGGAWSPSWSPDGQIIAFFSARDGKPRLYTIDAVGGTPRAYDEVPVTFDAPPPVWSPDGKQVMTIVALGGTAPLATPAPTASKSVVVFSFDPKRTTKEQAGSLLPPYLSRAMQLAWVDLESARKSVIAEAKDIASYSLSPSGNRVVLAMSIGHEARSFQTHYRVCVVLTPSAPCASLIEDVDTYAGYPPQFSWSPNGDYVAFRTRKPEYGKEGSSTLQTLRLFRVRDRALLAHTEVRSKPGTFTTRAAPVWAQGFGFVTVTGSQIEILDLAGRSSRRHVSGMSIIEPISRPATRSLTMSGEDGLFLVRDDRTIAEGPASINLRTGRIVSANRRGQAIRGPADRLSSVTGDGKFISYCREAIDEAPSCVAEPAAFGAQISLGELNPQFAGEAFGKSRLLQYRGPGGKMLRAALLLPSNYRKGHRYPMATWVYGFAYGSSDLNTFGLNAFNMQMLATRGFAVLWPDAPLRVGSTSPDLAATVMPAIDAAIAAGVADPKRLTVFGQSAGGYATTALITETDRFSAAAEANGPLDLFAFYGQLADDGDSPNVRWLESLNGGMGGDPWHHRARYERNSPYFRLQRVHTPLLLLHGTADSIPASQPDEIFTGLRALGRTVEYVRYVGEGHVAIDYTPAHFADWWSRIVEWFTRFTGA